MLNYRLLLRNSVKQLSYSRKYWRSIKFGGLVVGKAVKFKSIEFKCDLRDIRNILHVRVCAYYMYETTAKFKSANIFILASRDQTAKFKDRQYFRLYGNLNLFLLEF